jgi:chromosome segregation ATPase
MDKENAEMRVTELVSKLALAESCKRESENIISNLRSTVSSLESAYKDLVSEKETQSALLIGYHQRLENEASMYQSNSDSLKELYTSEVERNSERLNFYQSAYEEQVKRSSELSSLVSRIEADLATVRAEKAALTKLVEDEKIRATSRRESLIPQTPNAATESLKRDIKRLEMEIKSAHDDLDKYKELLRISETLVSDKDAKISELISVETERDQLRQQLLVVEDQLAQVRAELESSQTATAMDTSSAENISGEVREELTRKFLQQLEDKDYSIRLLEKRVGEYIESEAILVEKLSVAEKRVQELQESIRSERLVSSTRDTSTELSSMVGRLEAVERERDALNQRVELLRAENEKYLSYFASELSGRDEAGKSVLDQLKRSAQVFGAKESQFMMDLQRARSTVELLTRENMNLKNLVAERELLIGELSAAKIQIGELDVIKQDRDSLSQQVEGLRREVLEGESIRAELNALSQKLVASETELMRIRSELERTQSTAEEYKRLHAELVAKLGTSTAVNDKEVERLNNENGQLEKAKSLLTQTVSTLRQEAQSRAGEVNQLSEKILKIEHDFKLVQSQLQVKEKEVMRQDGLMKLKDKRIADLESAASSAAAAAVEAVSPQATMSAELMDLLDEYRTLVARIVAARKRESVYHDANSPDIDMQAQG